MATSSIQAFNGGALNGGFRPEDLQPLRVLTPMQSEPAAEYTPEYGADWIQRAVVFKKPDNTVVATYRPFTDNDTEVVIPDVNAGDKLWAHWENLNGWESVVQMFTFPNSDYTLAEGQLGTTSYPHLKAGLYRYSAEIALKNSSTFASIDHYDIQLKYGSSVLRAQSFLFDRSLPETEVDSGGLTKTVAQTHWFGGVFRMPSEGDLSIFVQNISNAAHPAKMKCSHIFVNWLGD